MEGANKSTELRRHPSGTPRYLVCPQIVQQSLVISFKGSGCSLVGRVVTSDARGPQFKSSHWQIFIMNVYHVNC